MNKEEISPESALGLFSPGPVVLVTAAHQGRVNVMTAAYTTSISSRPTLVGVAIRPTRLTYELIEKSKEFALNIPQALMVKQVQYCGSNSGRNVDKFRETGLHILQAEKVSAPLIEECLGCVECAVRESIELGDHILLVGEILRAIVEKEAFDGIWKLRTRETSPLHQVGIFFYSTLSEPFEP